MVKTPASTAGVVVGSLDRGLRFHMPCSVVPPKREQWLRAQVWEKVEFLTPALPFDVGPNFPVL